MGQLACLAVLNGLVVGAPTLILSRVLASFMERWDRVILTESSAWMDLESDLGNVFSVWDSLLPVCMVY